MPPCLKSSAILTSSNKAPPPEICPPLLHIQHFARITLLTAPGLLYLPQQTVSMLGHSQATTGDPGESFHLFLSTIQGPKQLFQEKQWFTCTTSNLVFDIRCSQYNFLFIGENIHGSGHRTEEYLYAVTTAWHFNSSSTLTSPSVASYTVMRFGEQYSSSSWVHCSLQRWIVQI